MATDSTLRILQKERATPISGQKATRFTAAMWALTKPDINFLIAITVLVSFLVARQGSHLVSILSVVNTIISTLFVSSGAAALNQFLERKFDGCMRRTARRPLVMGSITPRFALLFGVTISVVGLLYLYLWINPLSGTIASLTFVLYLFAYTPLKRISPLCTLVGALPGAAPTLIGWTAATGILNRGAWALYAVLFLWQFPHFMAIAWMYRDDYERAGYRVLPGYKERRLFAGLHASIPALLLIPVSLLPWIGRQTGSVYLAGAGLLGFGFAYLALRFARNTTNISARQLLFGSILYLPTILVLLLFGSR